MDNNPNTETLLRYLDGELNEAESAAVRTALENNTAAKEELDNLLLTRAVIKNYGLTQNVHQIHQEMMQEFNTRAAKPAVRRMYPRLLLRVAATVLLVVGLTALYQYMAVSPGSLYSDQQASYELANMRGVTSASNIEKAYSEKKYDAVIGYYTLLPTPTINEQFLTAQAYLHTGNLDNAISLFNTILQENKRAQTSTLNDDAEYYLALTYLEKNDTGKALPLFTSIHNHTNHLYHSKVSNWFLMKLKLLHWKN